MKNSGVLLVAALFCVSFLTASSQTTQQKAVQQNAQPMLDAATIVKQKINFASLPDTLHIRTSRGTVKTVGQIRTEFQNARMALEAKAKEVESRALMDFQAYRGKFLSSQSEVKRNLAIQNERLVARVKSAAPPVGINAPKVNPSSAVTTPAITSLDRDHGMFGEAVLITGTGFQTSPASVLFMVSADNWKEGGISYWSDTQIIATVPDNTGNPDYDGFVMVQKPFGKKSNPVRFRITSDQDLILLAGTGAAVILNGSWYYGDKPGGAPGCSDNSILHTYVGSTSDIMVYHDPADPQDPFGYGCKARDYLWQNLLLKNGWVVDHVVLTKVEGHADRVSVDLMNSILGTNNAAQQVAWSLVIDSLIDPPPYGLSYLIQVYIRGPKGVNYQ